MPVSKVVTGRTVGPRLIYILELRIHLSNIRRLWELPLWHSPLSVASVVTRVWSLSQCIVIRIQHCCSCGEGAADAQIWSLAWEPRYATGTAEKGKKKNSELDTQTKLVFVSKETEEKENNGFEKTKTVNSPLSPFITVLSTIVS